MEKYHLSSQSFSKSALRVVSIINCFTDYSPELSLSEISKKSGVPFATTYRILMSLLETRFLEKDSANGKYKIGPALYTHGSLYLVSTDINKAAEPVIEEVNNITGETVNVGILAGENVVLIMKKESKHDLRMTTHVGSYRPAHASSLGKALLSDLTETQLDELYTNENLQSITRNTIKTKTSLKLALKEIRETGVSHGREEAIEGVEGFGSLVRNNSGMAVSAISLSVPTVRLDGKSRNKYMHLIKSGASIISYRLGYQDSNDILHSADELRTLWNNK